MKAITEIRANFIDIFERAIYPAEILIENGRIKAVNRITEQQKTYILPGLIDAHVHIESSMLVPTEFARTAVKHGTIATISDPHEIANVLGIQGVDLMIENARHTPFYIYFGAPSCVPATYFETAGAEINSDGIRELLSRPEIIYLAEMMNFPGVIQADPEVMKKLEIAKSLGKKIDGHAPGLMGKDMKTYFSAGITTDHECYLHEEGLQKLKQGVKVLIREGSAAKNFDTLIPFLKDYPEQIMFCCDDKHPDSLVACHINDHVKRALKLGHDLYDVLRAASWNVMNHYGLPVGCLRIGDAADFIEIDHPESFNILKTVLKGEIVAENGVSYLEHVSMPEINQFRCEFKVETDFEINAQSEAIRVIEALDGQLFTNQIEEKVKIVDGKAVSDIENDVLKMVVINRYENVKPSVAFIKNFGLKKGAIAGSVAHDCHNIVAVGTNDKDLCEAVNLIIKEKGGLSLANADEKYVLGLPIAGIMTNQSAEEAEKAYTIMDRRAKELGSKLKAPYMTLSFMALLVIPALKLSDKGLFDGEAFAFTELFI